MTATPEDFDPIRHKEASRAQWDTAAEGWRRWEPIFSGWVAEATEMMLDMAEIGPGDHVLDLAAGAGDQSLKSAVRVGLQGRVLATDISQRMCAFIRDAAEGAGLKNLDTQTGAAEDLDLAPEGFDAAVCRLGLMLFSDPAAALRVVCRALRPGGRFAAVVFTTPEASPFFSMPMQIILKRTGQAPPAPGQPGLFALGAEGSLERTLAKEGLTDVRTQRVSMPVRLASARDAAVFLQEAAGAYRERVQVLPEHEQAAVWREIEEAYRAYEGDDGLASVNELLVGGGRRP